MSARRILVLDGNCMAATSIVQSLGRAGYELTLAAEKHDHPAFRSRFVARALKYPNPMSDKRAFQEWAVNESGYDLIIPSSERTLIPLDEIRDHAALAGKLALPPPRAVAIGFDKERVRALAEELGIRSPENVVIARLEELADHPLGRWLERGALVLKSVRSKVWGDGGGGRDLTVRMVTSQGELEREAARLLASGPIQVQAWVPGHGIGIGLLVDRGETVMAFAHERIHELPLTGGGSSYRRAIDPPEPMLSQSKKLLRALEWHGVAMVEFRHSPERGETFLMELNGRFWGSLALATFAGYDFPAALARLLLDGKRPPPPEARRVYARQLARDLDWFKEVARVRAGDLRRRGEMPSERKLLLVRPLVRSVLELGRLATGRETFDGAALDDPGPIAKEALDVVGRYGGAVGRKAQKWLAERDAVRAWRRPLPDVRRVLVVCSGNICRSAYAGARLAPSLAPLGLEVRSGALLGRSGRPSPALFQTVARRRGVELLEHRSYHVDEADLDWASLVLIMDDEHHRFLKTTPARAKVRWLGAIDGTATIPDPLDFGEADIERVLERLDRACARLVARLSTP
ncbi:MAG TPA: ATP-grasp domain-containing protein [Polyangia bacterium]|nr:ATP-grasp domain-containing protein [Polyangia bacterium]